MEKKFVQYIVVRKDLMTVLKWPVGSVIAQVIKFQKFSAII